MIDFRKFSFLLTMLLGVALVAITLGSGYGSVALAEEEPVSLPLMMPPDYQYARICKVSPPLHQQVDSERLKVRPLVEVSHDDLLILLKLNSKSGGSIRADYEYAMQVIDYIEALPARPEYFQLLNEALFIKQDMLHKGKGYEQDNEAAKEVLEMLRTRNSAKAYLRYAQIHESEGDGELAVQSYKQAIIHGNVSAYFDLARLYYERKVEVNDKEVAAAFSRAQDVTLESIARGDCRPMLELAALYRHMETQPDAMAHALAWYEQAAKTNAITPKMRYANLIEDGVVPNATQEQVVTLWKEAARSGSLKARVNLGDYYLSDADYQPMVAVRWYEQVAERQDAKVSTILRLVRAYQSTDEPSLKRIIALYERAAELGHVHAYHELGEIYQYDVSEDGHLDKALELYNKAAELGDAPSMRALQTAYSCNIGTRFDKDKAQYWKEKLESQSKNRLIRALYRALRDDEDQADAILERLQPFIIEEQAPDAMIAQAAYHYIQDDEDETDAWIEKALMRDEIADHRYAAHYELGRLYYRGRLFPENKKRALTLLNKAAEEGNPDALLMLGEMRQNAGDFDEAVSYYSRAALRKTSAYRKLYHVYRTVQDERNAYDALNKLAISRDVSAMLLLAQYYDYEESFFMDREKAQQWFNNAISSYPCKPDDVSMIAQSYMYGRNGAPRDPQEARKWISYLQAMPVEQHSDAIALARALLYLSYIDDAGDYADENARALDVLITMAQSGNQEARDVLIDYYMIRQQPHEVLKWLEQKAEEGDATAMLQLANLYLSGYVDTEEAKEKAQVWLERAEEAESENAAPRLKIVVR